MVDGCIMFCYLKAYDQTAESFISVKNTGKVRLHFNTVESNTAKIEPQKPFLEPSTVIVNFIIKR